MLVTCIDYNPLPEQSSLDAYSKVYQNGYLCNELANKELHEFLIEFKHQSDLVKIEVWADDEQGIIIFSVLHSYLIYDCVMFLKEIIPAFISNLTP